MAHSGLPRATHAYRLDLLLAILAVALMAGSIRALPPRQAAGPWLGWQVLAVPASQPEPEVLAVLKRSTSEPVVCRSTALTSLAGWNGELEQVTLVEATRRLDPQDPRRDAYFNALDRWFIAQDGDVEYSLFYVKEHSAFAPANRLQTALADLPPGSFLATRGVRAPPIYSLGFIVACLGIAGLLCMGSKRTRILRIALIVPFLIISLAGLTGVIGLLIAGWMCLISIELEPTLAEFGRTGNRIDVIRALPSAILHSWLLAIPGIGSFFATWNSTLSFCLAVAASFLLFLVALRHIRRDIEQKDHKPFVAYPITLKKVQRYKERAERFRFLPYAASIAALVLGLGTRFEPAPATTGGTARSELLLPSPQSISIGLWPGPEEARRLIRENSESELPTLADWLAHQAFQESLFTVQLKNQDNDLFRGVSIPLPNGAIRQGPSFSNAWARNAYRSIPNQSIEAVLRSQGGFGRYLIRPLASKGSRPLASHEAILYILLLVFPLYGALTSIPRRERDGSVRKLYEIS